MLLSVFFFFLINQKCINIRVLKVLRSQRLPKGNPAPKFLFSISEKNPSHQKIHKFLIVLYAQFNQYMLYLLLLLYVHLHYLNVCLGNDWNATSQFRSVSACRRLLHLRTFSLMLAHSNVLLAYTVYLSKLYLVSHFHKKKLWIWYLDYRIAPTWRWVCGGRK